MNRSFIVAVLTVTMIIMKAAAGYAIYAPHNLACDACHGKFISTPTIHASNNSCTTCHNSMGEAAGKPIDSGAMSNYFGSAVEQSQTGSRSSHTWGAYSASGHPYNKAAMVHEPSNAALAKGYNNVSFVGTTLCVRCHNSKADATSGLIGPFLRSSNSNDALCRDCHSKRDLGADAVANGTHPINFRAYSSVYKSNTTAYRRVPISANQYNPTANPGNYLTVNNKGKLLCTTCHGTHNADSSSATLDNMSTAAGLYADDPAKGLKGQLQNSKGQLLRTDQFGATAAAISLCSSCHKETANINHNKNGQNIQCGHCHGAHVDYNGASPSAGELLKNLNLVRRDFSNISISKGKSITAGKSVIFNTATSLRFKRADGRGICQVCHTPTPGVAIHDLDDTRREDCLACHQHSNGFSAVDCTTCHGQPPININTAAAGYTLDETYTPHATHAGSAYYNYACKNCHYDGTKAGYHNTGGSFADVFIDTTGSVGSLAGFPNSPANYNSVDKTCANVYCHSNGNPRGGTITWKSAETPTWENGSITKLNQPCSSCHEFGATLVSNAHSKHVNTVALKCSVCHAATVNEIGGIADRTKHANGTKDVSFNGQYSGTFNTGDASCTNTCHGSGTPKWTDGPMSCNSCHAVPPTSGDHTDHFTAVNGPKLGLSETTCSNCHDAVHANGRGLDVKTCTPCHPTGTTPVWNAAVTCASCHTGTASVVGSYTAPLKDDNAIIGHGQYSLASQCTACHDATKNHIGAGAAEKRLKTVGNALCTDCHTPVIMQSMSTSRASLLTHGGSINAFANYTAANSTTAIATRSQDCAGCHDTHGTSNRLSIRTVINGLSVSYTNTSTGFISTTADGNGIYHGLCQVCHTKTSYYRNNGNPETHYTKNCLDCHSHKAGMFAFQGSGGCSGCHGYPPVRSEVGLKTFGNYTNAKFQDYSGGGGAHTVKGHIARTVNETNEFTKCTDCHFTGLAKHKEAGSVQRTNIDVVVDPKFKFSNTTSITYNFNSSTCSNVSCHFKPSPNWTNGLQ